MKQGDSIFVIIDDVITVVKNDIFWLQKIVKSKRIDGINVKT